jgi:DNA-binding beta-propeller fold protein YncE
VQKIRANNSSCVDDIKGFAVVDKIPVRRGAISGLAVGPDGKLIITHYGDDSFSVIDPSESAVVQTTVGVDEPFAVAVSDSSYGRAYISTVSAAYDSILSFDMAANRVVATHPMAYSVADIAVSPDGRYVYASRTAAHGVDVAILNTETGSEDAIGIAADAGSTAGCLRVSPDGRQLYVAINAPCAAELVVIDTRTIRVRKTFEIGCPIRDIALTRDGATAYVASCGPDFGVVLDVLDIRGARIDTYKLGEIAGMLTQLALSRDGERAYLVGDAGVTMLSTATHDVIGTIALGVQPSCVTESPDGTRLYIADYAGGITELTTASAETANADDAATAAHRWAFADQLGLEPTPA